MRWLVPLLLAAAPAGPKFEDAQATAVLTVAADKATIAITVAKGFHLNDDYPINFVPAASKDVTYAAKKVTKAEMALTACADHAEQKCAATVPVAFKGKGEVSGQLAFAVCDPEICLIKKATLTAKTP